jgi:hypothetical protein
VEVTDTGSTLRIRTFAKLRNSQKALVQTTLEDQLAGSLDKDFLDGKHSIQAVSALAQIEKQKAVPPVRRVGSNT